MEVAKELMEKWKALKSSGDIAELAKISTMHPETFSRAFKTGKASDSVFKIMAEYYQKKADTIKSYL